MAEKVRYKILFAGSFEEDGWRDYSPSDVKQGFKIGWENDSTDFDLSYKC